MRVEIIAIHEIRNISIIKYGTWRIEEINKHLCFIHIYKFYRNNEKEKKITTRWYKNTRSHSQIIVTNAYYDSNIHSNLKFQYINIEYDMIKLL